MIKKITIIFILLIINQIIYSQNISVKFEITIPYLPENPNVYISGNKTELGEWQPNIIKFENLTAQKRIKQFSFPKGTILEFKITRGSWDNEAIYHANEIPQNFFLKITNDTIVRITVPMWKDQVGRSNDRTSIVSTITGNIKYHKNLVYKNLRPRDIIVWLPPSYFSNPEKKFPVLYMQDGQNIVDPATSSFGNEWRIDEVADSLINLEEIHEMIIVGINNTFDRRQEYTPGEKGEMYMSFIVNSLKPFIDSVYRTKPEREFTAVGGASTGGTISFMLLWKYDNIFSKAICMSPAFQISDVDVVSWVKNYYGEKKDILLYIDNGGVGLDSVLQFGIDKMMKTLETKNYTKGIDYFWFLDEKALHNEIAWASRIYKPLKLFYERKKTI